jgi:hypothetical protein
MTHDEIMNMPAGFRMDSLIAVSVLGMELVKNDGDAGGEFWVGDGATLGQIPKRDLPQFSTDISAVWDVIEKFQGTAVRITKAFGMGGAVYWVRIGDIDVCAPTTPLAICRAAYLAMVENK